MKNAKRSILLSKLKYPLEKKKDSFKSNTIDTHYEKSQVEILLISMT